MSLSRAVQLLTAAPITVGAGKKKVTLASPTKAEATFAISYMDAFGYLEQSIRTWDKIKIEDITKAIGLFQNWFGLKKSLQLDPATVKAMEWPRCGHPECLRAHHGKAAKVKEFINSNLPRWTKDGITYGFASFVPGISQDEQRKLASQAFQAWCRHGNLSVTEGGGSRPDIVLHTGQGARSNFDGPGGTLAWAYLPDGSNQQLEMRFDLGETWITDARQRGILYLNVACHEFGHLLGLDHSKVKTALMAPYYSPAVDAPQANDDIPRFQARYGERTTPPDTPPPSAKPKVVITGDVAVEINGRQVA